MKEATSTLDGDWNLDAFGETIDEDGLWAVDDIRSLHQLATIPVNRPPLGCNHTGESTSTSKNPYGRIDLLRLGMRPAPPSLPRTSQFACVPKPASRP
ncbi:hypothetical protein KFK09_009081 [Dendrobium nobile]|uniref:Uncharacterized protein n=1 Tax=Dendrobium nobile TaxID=94219 RepID=A0A8T3BRE8_DENNO|nr:hypothetical protein KFK09_009081 [Dendrobium nobile]